ncbi:Uncharacterised protein [Salmonella enterica subsp. houtenae serovar Houten]|nr:Uncharacterised protein [Salmonella enterica subsp. houtenae serovar Houten]SUF53054.1 Uncharacterised protein [Salmonella enterica]VEA94760.1 Uncharacterised protein [Salmonella enterica subsp. houtenae]VFS09843.1 Uncharacterised protein [Salmonella enterica subsp. houtenae]VUD26784.1 Uncharacterised protein [Salmonella sp. NCTC 7297]
MRYATLLLPPGRERECLPVEKESLIAYFIVML